jgi:filamentous hemagglutinin
MALIIVRHPKATLKQKVVAAGYIAVEGGAHAALAAGTGALAWEVGSSALLAGSGATGEALEAACADGDCTNEVQAVAKATNALCAQGKCLSEINTGTNVVYKYVENGVTRYVGITNNFSRRAAEHLRLRGWRIEPIYGLEHLSREDARAVEQVLIEYYGLWNLYNRINSIAASNPIYQDAIQRGREILKEIGFLK